MSSGPNGWLPLIFTTLVAGGLGAVITTYGGQARQRRQARSDVLATLQRLEIARRSKQVGAASDYDVDLMAELWTRCVIARVPESLVALYELANDAPRHRRTTIRQTGQSSPQEDLDVAVDVLAFVLTTQSARLLAVAVWHPWLSVLYQRRRAQALRQQITRAFPSANWPDDSLKVAVRSWERARAVMEQQTSPADAQQRAPGPR